MEVREDGDEGAEGGEEGGVSLVVGGMDGGDWWGETHFMPTPPATKMILCTVVVSSPGGGQTKLPPTRTRSSVPRISSSGRQSHAAGGLDVFWTASSRYAEEIGEDAADRSGEVSGFRGCNVGSASRGVEVMVKPPAWGRDGMCTSSHWPARNCAVEIEG